MSPPSLLLYLGSALQLVHGRVVGRLPGGTLCGADEFSERLGHVPHRVYQNHLRRRSRCECKHNGQSLGLSQGPSGRDLTPEPLSLPPINDTSGLGEGRRGTHAGSKPTHNTYQMEQQLHTHRPGRTEEEEDEDDYHCRISTITKACNGSSNLSAVELKVNKGAEREYKSHTAVTAGGGRDKSFHFLITCVSGPSEPMLVAPSLTTSVS